MAPHTSRGFCGFVAATWVPMIIPRAQGPTQGSSSETIVLGEQRSELLTLPLIPRPKKMYFSAREGGWGFVHDTQVLYHEATSPALVCWVVVVC